MDNAGKPLAKNPMKDVRVRRAMSLAINREGLKTQIMDGFRGADGAAAAGGCGGVHGGPEAGPV